MELKVWVDGIQRVVCGANLATTCQDVVMALAHAMGRTGRFTLIEKWRDSERPLTPGECPLKALQKWGEYAAEVRFYLMQAEHQQDKPPQKSPKQRSAQLAETLDDDFSHNFTPPTSQLSHSSSSSSSKHPHHHLPHQQHPNQQPQQRQLIPQASQPVPDSIKRSSTFSGTLNSNHPPIPQSTSLHAKLDNLKQQQQQQQYPQRSHPQQHHPQQPPRPNHSGQKRLQQPVNNSNDSNGNTKTPQQYQNVPIAPKPSQNVRSRSNQNTPHPPPPQPPHKPIPIPSSKSQNRPNGNLSARSSGSSNQSASPRNPSTGQHSKSLSPGRGGNNGSVGPIPMSSSPSQDTRHLHPANIPRPSGTYSNFPPPNSDQQQQQQQQQQQPRPKPSTSSSSPSTPRPVPTPRSGHHQPRQQSPSSSSSVPYENLPPVRRSSSSYGTEPPPYPPPPSSSSSSSHPPENQTETEPRPPSRRRRERGRSANDPGNKLENNTQNNIRNEEDENQLKAGRFMSNDKPFVNAPEINQRGGDRLYQKKMNDNKFVLNKLSNNDHNNSDLSDDCFQGPDTSLKTPNNSQSVNYPNKVVNNAPRSAHGKDFPPAPFTKTQMFPPVPQLSQTLPSYSSSSSSPSRSRSSETAGQRLTKSQTLSPSANPVTPERTRRSDGGGRVNFVESALLRQQRSNPDADLNAGRNTERQHRDSSRDGRPSVEQLPHPTGNNRYRGDNSQEFAYPAMSTSHAQYFPGQDEDHYDSRYGNDRNVTDFTDSISPQLTNNNHGLSASDFHHQNHHQQPAQQQHQQRHHHPSPQQSSRTSAFKVVSPRSSSSNRPSPLSSSHSPQSSPISPTSYGTPPVAYNLDSQNFDLPVNLDHHHHHLHPSSYPEFPSSSSTSPSNLRPHVRQTSLEIEEYDLDQNFPDVSHKDGLGHHYYQQQSSTLPRIAGRKGQGQGQMTEYVMDRQGVPPPSSSSSSSLEPEYMRMLRQVKMQQEQLKMLESQVNDVDAEISTLETEQSDLDLKLDVVGTELSSLEKTEEMVEAELEELDRVEWVNVLDGEVKCEDDLRLKMSKLTVELTGVEKEIVKVGEEEKTKEEALRVERLRREEEEKKEEMEAKEALQRLTETKDDLSSLEASIRQQEEEMKALEKGIKDVEDRIKSQEVEADRLENLLLSENLKEFRSKPVPKEPPPSSSSPVTVTTTKITTDLDNNIVITKTPVVLDSSSRPTTPRSRPPSETGEAILKLLEDHLSPRVSPSPATNDDGTTADGGGSGSGNTTSSTHHNPLKSSTTTTTLVKNPNGVWV